MYKIAYKQIRYYIIIIFPLFAFLANIHPIHAQNAKHNNDITLGMSTALSGPASFLGVNMQAGVLAAIKEINHTGGINSHDIRLITLDDGYEPTLTIPNIHKLINEENVLSIIGNVGTPTAVAAVPITNKNKVLFYGAFTGAGILRKHPPDRYVINFRASYAEETEAMVNALCEHAGVKPEEIAFFTQRDTYGDAGYSGGMTALIKHGLIDESSIVHARYERNSLAVENALADIILGESTPRAIIMVGAYAPCAKFIRLAKSHGLNPLFLNVSFVGAEQLNTELGAVGNGVIVTQVVPHYDSDTPIVHDYLKALKELDNNIKPTFASLEGYVAARILFKAMQLHQTIPTRSSIVDYLEELGDFDIGLNTPLHLTTNDHQASHLIWPTIFQDGKIHTFEWADLKNTDSGKS